MLLQGNNENGGCLIPMMMHCYEHDEDPEMRPEPISPEKREEVIAYMVISQCGAVPPEIFSTPKCDKLGVEAAVMKSRQGYKGYVIEARSCQQQDGEFSAELWIEEHDASGVTETQFYLPDTFPTQESAIEAVLQAGRQKIDAGFERGSVVASG